MANYAIVKLNGSFTVNGNVVEATLFPKVPWEAVAKSVNEMDTPVGTPATVIELIGDSASGESLSPTSAGQKYYNTTDKLIYTAVDNDGTIEWGETGAQAAAGQIYMMRKGSPQVDTLYVKSVVNGQYNGLALVTSYYNVAPYAGPFLVQGAPQADKSCRVTVTDPTVSGSVEQIYCGRVVVGTLGVLKVGRIQSNANMVVPNNTALFLFIVLNGTTLSTVIEPGSYTGSGTVKQSIRLAFNRNGIIYQCQYGDVTTGNLT